MTESQLDSIDLADRFDSRIGRLREVAQLNNVDAVIVTAMSNLLYLSNLRSSAGILVVGAKEEMLHLLVDFRYQAAATTLIDKQETPRGLEVIPVMGSYEEALCGVLERAAVTRVGIEAAHMTVRQWQWLDGHVEAELVPLVEVVERLRMVKDDCELATLRRAGRLLSEVVPEVLTLAGRRRPELEIAREIDRLVLQAGFERVAFETIVASGPNSALPHAHPTARELSDWDVVILDFGGVLVGFSVDISRTVSVGVPPAACGRLYAAVEEAQLAAIESVCPGVMAEEVDGAARIVLDRHGLGEAFGHSTGHGLGLDVHELPRVGRTRADVKPEMLVPGMVFTIEPGAYVPGLGGVRIEDDVAVSGSGVELLTCNERGLVVV